VKLKTVIILDLGVLADNFVIQSVKLPDQRSGLLKGILFFYGIHLRLKVGAFCQLFRKIKEELLK